MVDYFQIIEFTCFHCLKEKSCEQAVLVTGGCGYIGPCFLRACIGPAGRRRRAITTSASHPASENRLRHGHALGLQRAPRGDQ